MKQNWRVLCLLLMSVVGCGGSQTTKSSPLSNQVDPSAHPQQSETDSVHEKSAPTAVIESTSINRLPGFDADIFHYADQGSGFFPLDALKALIDSETNKPFLENLERFGLVSGMKSERNPNGFPIGIVTNTVEIGTVSVEMFGFTCSACHTSEIRYQGKTILIEGGSGLFYVDKLGDAIGSSMQELKKDKTKLLAFLKRLIQQLAIRDGVKIQGLDEFEKLADDGSFGQGFVQHVEERFSALFGDLKSPPPNPVISELETEVKSVIAAAADRLHKLSHALSSPLQKLTDENRHSAIVQMLSKLEQCKELLEYRKNYLKMRDWLSVEGHRLKGGYGRADDFGTARVELFGNLDETAGTPKERNMEIVNAPVSCPSLWNIENYAWLHWNSNTNSVIQRSIGESIGVGATYTHDFMTSVNISNQMKIEQQISRFEAPKWPEELLGKIDSAKRERGYQIYKDQCAECHDPTSRDVEGLLNFRHFTLDEIGTDQSDAVNFSKPVFLKDGTQSAFAKEIGKLLEELQAKAKSLMSPGDQQLMDQLERTRRPVKWRDPVKDNQGKVYPAKPLDGIWATAPYLHNGSVPTLYHLLLPVRNRPASFVVGSNEFLPKVVGFEWDPKEFTSPDLMDKSNPEKKLFLFETSIEGNLNTGHEYGADLSDDDRWALVEYLKVHRTPDVSGN